MNFKVNLKKIEKKMGFASSHLQMIGGKLEEIEEEDEKKMDKPDSAKA